MDNLSETSLHGSLADLHEEAGQVSTQELEDYLQIITKPEETRKTKETERLISKIIDLDIFDRSLLENLDPKPVVTKLIPFLRYEQFPAGTPIFHYEQPADKMYIIFRGKAREFVPKNLDTIEKESRSHYRSDPISKDASLSIADMPTPSTITALASLPEGHLGTLETIYEQTTGEKAVSTPGGAAKKFRKMKALFPFLKKMIAQKSATQRISDYSYKQSLRKPRKAHHTNDFTTEIYPETLGTNIDVDILEEFKRHPKAYFIGGVLKVQFSRYLYAGDNCGVRALKDNALRTLAVIAEEDCHCISLHKDDFFEVLEHEKSLNVDKIEFFRKMFDKFDEQFITKFALLWEHQTLKNGDTIFQENDPSEYLYALFKGEITISKVPPNAKRHRASVMQELPFRIKKRNDHSDFGTRVATLCPRDFFGDEDFFQGTSRQFTATVSSIRAKIFRLPLEKYKAASKKYSEIFKEIKSMTSLKLKWNKERFDNGNQNSSQIHPQSLTALSEKEKALAEVGQFLSPSNNPRHSLNSNSNKLRESLEPQRNEFSKIFSQPGSNLLSPKTKIEVRSCIWGDEKSQFISPKSSTLLGENQKIVIKMPQTLYNQTKNENNVETKAKYLSLEPEDELFNRLRPPREYTPKQEELMKKNKEISIDSSINFFPVKKSNTAKRQTIDGSKMTTATRGSSIELLKRKVFDSRLEEAGGSKISSQKLHSIEIDKPQSHACSQSTLGSLNSITEKMFQKSNIGSLVSPRSSKIKPRSLDKANHVLSENHGGNNTKKTPVNFHVSKLLDHPKSESTGYYFAPVARVSTKSRCRDISKSQSTFQALTPKAENNDENKEAWSGFRIIGIVGAKAGPDNLRSSVGEMRNRSIYS